MLARVARDSTEFRAASGLALTRWGVLFAVFLHTARSDRPDGVAEVQSPANPAETAPAVPSQASSPDRQTTSMPNFTK